MPSPTSSSMPTVAFATLAFAVVFSAGGCGDFEEAMNAGRDTTVAKPESTAPDAGFLQEPAAAHGNPGGADPNVGPLPPQSSPSDVPPVVLSAGVALPQTLPTGTGMSFSVDYQFRQGQPDPSNKYVWVIKARDEVNSRQMQLAGSGNLTLIVEGLRPEAGPFSSHIVEIAPDGSQRKVSRSIDLR